MNEGNVGQEARPPLVVRLGANEFQQRVLDKLGRLETKVDMIVGNGQPGRMQMAEDRLGALEKNDLRRTVYDRIAIAGITFAITFAISAMVAWREYLGFR
jgi:hypothetical protein